jgi:hypothetical protein
VAGLIPHEDKFKLRSYSIKWPEGGIGSELEFNEGSKLPSPLANIPNRILI